MKTCVAIVLAAFHCFGIDVETVPSIAITEDIPFEAIYVGDRIYMKDPNKCDVLAHEFVHHLQYLNGGPARSAAQWWDREAQAIWLSAQIMECR